MYPELKKVLNYIVDVIDSHKLATMYSELAQVYEQVAATSSPDTTELINKSIKEIKKTQVEIDPKEFDIVSQHAFQRLDMNNVLGVDANERFDIELSQISNNPHAASTAIQNMANQASQLRTMAANTLEGLNNLWGDTKSLDDGYVELQIVFDGNVAIKTFYNMQEQADFWDRFLRLTNHVLSDGADKAEIITLFKINPSGVSVAAKAKHAVLILEIFSHVLSITNSLTLFKQAEVKIYLLPSCDEKKEELLKMLKEQENEELEKQIQKHTEIIAEKLKKVIPNGPQRNDSMNGIRVQLKELYKFSLEGGSVSVVNVAEDQKSKIKREYYNLPEKTKQLQNIRKELNNPEFPKALMDEDEKRLIKNPPKIEQSPTPKVEQSSVEKRKRGRPPKQKE